MNLPLLLLWLILFPHYPSHAMHSLCHCSLNVPHIPIVHLLFPLLECASINLRISNFLISCRSCSNVSLMLALKGKWQPPPHPLSSLIIYFTSQHLAPYGIICIYMDTHTLYIFYIYFLFSFYSLSLAWKLPKDESSLFFTLEPLVLYSRNINKSKKPDTHYKGAEEVITSVVSNTCDPMGYSLPGFSVHGILQARMLGWVANPFSRGSFWPRHQTCVYHIVDRFFSIWITREDLWRGS